MVLQSLLSTIAAPISLLESFTGSFRQPFEPVQPEPNFGTPVNGTDGSGYGFRYTDVPVDRLGRFQARRVEHAVWYDGRFQSNDRVQRMQRGGWSQSTGQGEPIAWRRPEPSTVHLKLANDAASFPLNGKPARDDDDSDTASGNGSGFMLLLVCAVRSHRIFFSFLVSASDRSYEPTHDHIHNYLNLTLLILEARNIIDP